MSVRLTEAGLVELHWDCGIEDAEPLLGHLTDAKRTVDWRECDTAHAAVVQILLISGAELVGPPRGAFLRTFVEPALNAQ
jgi:hypothetical protein